MAVYFFLNMKKKRYGVNVRKLKKIQILRSPQDLQQGWNPNPCEKL